MENLFREVVAALSDQALTRNLAAVELLREHGDLAAMLTETGRRLAECYCDERSCALRRLLHAEITSMPDLLDIVRDRAADRVNDALATRLARPALAGRLKLGDPAIAARWEASFDQDRVGQETSWQRLYREEAVISGHSIATRSTSTSIRPTSTCTRFS